MFRIRTIPVLIIGMLSAAAGVFADTVYNQPASFPGGDACDCWTSAYGADLGGGYQTFDNFQLGSAADIGAVTWQGLYDDFENTGNNPVGPDTTSWEIEFWSDNSGIPGSPLFGVTLPAASVNTTFVGVASDLGSTENVYSFQATLPSIFAASAATTYWFSVLSLQPTFDPIFSWTLGTGGDGFSQQENIGSFGGGITQQDGDRAFSLETVPEPATLPVLGIALIGLAALKRRQRPA
jgi:hypothetical protein